MAAPSFDMVNMVQETMRFVDEALKEFEKGNGNMMNGQSVILIGPTGVGKSTLINLLAGVKLTPAYDNTMRKAFFRAENGLPNFKIGDSKLSQTTIPHKCEIDGVMYWDCPGLDDNRSAAQEIANAVSIKKVFEVSTRIKILFMVDRAEIWNNRATNLLEHIRALDILLLGEKEKVDALGKAMSLVVSQTKGKDKIEHVQKNMEDVIKANLLDGTALKIFEYLKNGPISLFNKPKEGANAFDAETTRNTILKNVEKMEYAVGLRVKMVVSQKCILILTQTYNKLYKDLQEIVEKFNLNFKNFVENVMQSYSGPKLPLSETQRQDAMKKLKDISSKLKAITDQEYSIENKNILDVVNTCKAIANENNYPLEDVLKSLEDKVDMRNYLEQFMTQGLHIPIDIISSIRGQVRESRNQIKMTIINIKAKDNEEKAELEKKRARDAEKEKEIEKNKAAAALKKAEDMRAKLEAVNKKATSEQEEYMNKNYKGREGKRRKPIVTLGFQGATLSFPCTIM